jgi:hypothetical protein
MAGTSEAISLEVWASPFRIHRDPLPPLGRLKTQRQWEKMKKKQEQHRVATEKKKQQEQQRDKTKWTQKSVKSSPGEMGEDGGTDQKASEPFPLEGAAEAPAERSPAESAAKEAGETSRADDLTPEDSTVEESTRVAAESPTGGLAVKGFTQGGATAGHGKTTAQTSKPQCGIIYSDSTKATNSW